MSITNQWENPEKTILYQKFEGNWEVDDLINSFAEVGTMLDNVSHPVNVIADLSEGKAPASFISRFAEMNEANFMDHPNADRVFLVGTSKFVEMLANTFIQFGGLANQLIITGTFEEAYNMIGT